MRKRTLAALAGAVLTVTACSGGGDASLATGEGYTVLGALKELPAAAEDQVTVHTGDLVAATELAGLERPTTLEGPGAAEWVGQLADNPMQAEDEGPSVFVPFADALNIQQLNQHEEFETAVGFTILEVDAFTELYAPPQTFAVVTGEFDDDTLPADLPEVTDEVVSFGEGEDGFSDVSKASAVSRLGTPVRLAHQDGRIALSGSTTAVQDWATGSAETLADDPSLAAVATSLDDRDVVSAVVQSGSFRAGATIQGTAAPEEVRAQLEEQAENLPSVAFGAVGVGWAAGEEGTVAVVVYDVGSEDAAAAAADPIETQFREGTTLLQQRPLNEYLDVLSVEADGRTVVVTGTATGPGASRGLLQLLHQRDVPFVHN